MLYKYSWLIRADKRFNVKGSKWAPSAHQTASSKITYYNKTGKADPPIRRKHISTYFIWGPASDYDLALAGGAKSPEP